MGRQSVAYLVGEDSGIGFGSVLWGEGKLVSVSGDFYPLYPVRLSNFRDGENLTTSI